MGYESALNRISSAAAVETAAIGAPNPGGLTASGPAKFSKTAAAQIGVTGGWSFLVFQALILLMSSVISGVLYHELAFGVRGPLKAFFAVGVIATLLYTGAMRMVEQMEKLRTPLSFSAIRDASFAWLAVLLILSFAAFALKTSADISRGFCIVFFVVGYFSIVAARASFPSLHGVLPSGFARHANDAIVIGAKHSPALGTLLVELAASGIPSPKVIAIEAGGEDGVLNADFALWMGRIFAASRQAGHGEICIVAEGLSAGLLESITNAIRVIPRGVRIILPPPMERMLHLPVRSIGRIYSVEVQRSPMGIVQRTLKRAFDVMFSVPLVIFLLPAFAIIAVCIKSDSKGPVLFRQRRLGYRGEPFRILKFRTMTTFDDGDDVRCAERRDPRTTRVGSWLRRASLDELPQLFNVILGDMSLIGPRPHALAHDVEFSKKIVNYEVRQHVKPGITGWAQVNGLRGGGDVPEWIDKRVEFDIWYAKNANIWLDMKIFVLTPFAILRQTNAY